MDGVVFMVDSADTQRFDDSRKELNALLAMNETKDVPFLVIGNKIDKQVCCSFLFCSLYMHIVFTVHGLYVSDTLFE